MCQAHCQALVITLVNTTNDPHGAWRFMQEEDSYSYKNNEHKNRCSKKL